MDCEKQKDEITALESIYSDEEFSYCLKKYYYELTFHVFINLPEKYFFIFKDDEKNNEVQKVYVDHLPPLTLIITLPKDYPSISPPKLLMKSSWLKLAQMRKLGKHLYYLWKTNKGQEIIFIWISFLQSETLTSLNIENFIDMNDIYEIYKNYLKNMKSNSENIGLNSNVAKENIVKPKETVVDKKELKRSNFKKRNNKMQNYMTFWYDRKKTINPLKLLIDHNKIRCEIEFKKSFYLCKICFNEKSGENCIKFSQCDHIFCKECTTGYFESKIKEGTVNNIKCPDDDCKFEALPNLIKELVSPALFLQYDTFLLNTTLDTMPDIIYCPRKLCQYPCIREQNEVMASCPVCDYTFCILCKAVYHGIEPCKLNKDEKHNLVETYQKASNVEKLEMEKKYGKNQLQKCVSNVLSENWIEKNSRSCPKCNTAIEKIDGCNKMTCWKCQANFCWLCSTRLLNKSPYDHFNDPKSECYQKLYEGLFNIDQDEGDELDDEIEFMIAEIDDFLNSDDEEDLNEDLYQFLNM